MGNMPGMTEPLLGPNRLQETLSTEDAVRQVLERAGGSWFVDLESESRLGLQRVREVLFEEQSPYQLIQVADFEELGKTLILDGRVQLAESDEHVYHEMFVHPAMVWGRYRDVLVLGGGDGCLVRELAKWSCVRKIVLVELDEAVIACSRDHLSAMTHGALEDPRLEVICADAVEVLERDEEFDLVLADLTEPYDDSGVAGELSSGLFSRRFWSGVRAKLRRRGMFAVQTGGLRLGRSSLDVHHASFVRGLKKVFGHVRVAYEFIPSYEAFWTVTFASPEGFNDKNGHLTGMWNLPAAGEDAIDDVLEDENVVTRYYDGVSHVRLFTPPVPQATLYGWDAYG